MAGNTYTSDDLIDDILLLGHVPLGNNTFTSATILRLATLEMQTPIAAQILATRGNYYMTYEDQEIVSTGLYDIPPDCVAGALVNVELVNGPTIIPVNLIEESEQFSTIAPTSTSYGFFMRGNQVQILPTPNVGVARFWYSKRMSDLILTTKAAQVATVAGNVITVDSLPSTIVQGSYIDGCGDKPPFNILGSGIITNIASLTITLDGEITGLLPGDWLALNNQTPIPQLPVEYRLVLAQSVVVKIYELQGYLDKMAVAQKKLDQYLKNISSLITPRVKSQTKVISPVNGGFLSGNQNRLTNFPASRGS